MRLIECCFCNEPITDDEDHYVRPRSTGPLWDEFIHVACRRKQIEHDNNFMIGWKQRDAQRALEAAKKSWWQKLFA